VKKAPFIVLIGANMPSILAEISFVSNPTNASCRPLSIAAHRRVLYRGIAKYVRIKRVSASRVARTKASKSNFP
jgi:N-acetylmuramoyl-L-alanine amidase